MVRNEARAHNLIRSVTRLSDRELCARYIAVVRELTTTPEDGSLDECRRRLKDSALALLREMRSRQRSRFAAN